METPETVIVECHGRPRERGRQYGEATREGLRHNLANWAERKGTPEELAFFGATQDFLARRAPDLLEEMEGLAQGCGQPIEDILWLNHVATFGPDWLGECTSMAVADGPDGPVLGKNNDGGGVRRHAYVVRTTRPDKGLPMIQVTHAGSLSGLDAMNAEGLVNSHNSVGSRFDRSGERLDVRLRCYQLMAECRTTRDFIEAMTRDVALTGKGFNIVAVDRAGETAVIEAAVPLIAWRDLGAPFVYATNHYMTPALKDHDGRSPEGKRISTYRVGYLEWVAATNRPSSADDIRGILSSHEPWAPCRHGGPHLSETEWSLVALPRERKLLFADGHPCETGYRAFGF